MARSYEFRHVVAFEETNLVGNVYYVNHLRWQGRCRELFLREHAPLVLDRLAHGLSLATTKCSCEYFSEIFAFDEVIIRMRLETLSRNRLSMTFDYLRLAPDGTEELVARGEQEVACLCREGNRLVPCPIPDELAMAVSDPDRD